MTTDAETERAEAFLAENPITDDAQEALDEMVIDMANHRAADDGNQVEGESDFDALHDDADAMASRINNEGPEAQVAWLISEGCQENYIRDIVFGDAPAPGA